MDQPPLRVPLEGSLRLPNVDLNVSMVLRKSARSVRMSAYVSGC